MAAAHDVFDTAKRSAIMRAVKSRDTAPELAVRAAVCALGLARRYRLNGAHLPGKPDLVFGAMDKVVFVHGCFWHGHECKRGARQPKDNASYWRAKIARNRSRDATTLRTLRAEGWSALVVWECETRDAPALSRETKRKRAPQSAGRPGDHHPLVDELSRGHARSLVRTLYRLRLPATSGHLPVTAVHPSVQRGSSATSHDQTRAISLATGPSYV